MIRCSSLGRNSEELPLSPGSDGHRRYFDLLGSERNTNLFTNHQPLTALNPWKRFYKDPRAHFLPEVVNSVHEPFTIFNVNVDLDVFIKRAVLKVSPSVVSLISYSGGNRVFWCSGVIFASFWKDDSLYYLVLTSATLLRPPYSHACDIDYTRGDQILETQDDICLPIDEKIDVYLRGGKLCEGTVMTYDTHYNIAVLTFKSDNRLPCAVLRPIDDSLAMNNAPTDVKGSACRFPYLPVKLHPGDAVIAVGRFSRKPSEIMAAPGRYRSADSFDEKTKLNCMDLFMADCKTTKCGIGGPLISCEGEVIGIMYYAEHGTPFLPINIFLKWWSHHKVTRSHCRPSLGMKVANLYTADLVTLDQARKLDISQGLIVEKVLSGTPAESCGLHPGDVVVKCSDTIVVSPLQFFEIIWDMAGKAVEVVVVREGSYKNMTIEVKDITSADEFYQWPLPRVYERMKRY